MMITPAAERCGKPAGFSKGLWESRQRFPWSRRLSAAGGSAPEIRPSFVSKSLTRSGSGLGNPGLPSHLDLGARSHQPLDPFQQAAQDLPSGCLRKQRQSNDVVDHNVGRKVPVANARLMSPLQDFFDALGREHPCHHPKGDVVRDPAPTFQSGYGPGHSCARL